MSSLSDGQIIPQFDPKALEGFGYAWNEFYGPLPTYIIALLKVIFGSYPLANAIFNTVTLFLSGVLVYRLVNLLSQTSFSYRFLGLCATTVFIFSNSTYINLYYYANPSQPLAIVFVLLSVFGITLLFTKRSFQSFLMITIAFAGLPLTHIVTTICVAPFIIIYIGFLIFRERDFKEIGKNILIGLASLLTAVGLSAFFLFPMIENLASKIYNISNPTFTHSFGWDDISYFTGSWDSLFNKQYFYYIFPSFICVLCVVIVLALSLIHRKDKRSHYSIIFSVFSLLIVYMQLPIFPWKLFSIFTRIQTPARFSTLFGVFSALSIGLILPVLLRRFSYKYLYLFSVSILIIFSLFFSMEFRERIQKGSKPLFANTQKLINDSEFRYEKIPDSIAIGEYLPQALGKHYQTYNETVNQFRNDKNPYGMREQSIKYLIERGKEPKWLAGDGSISHFQKNGSHITLRIDSKTKSLIELPELYYKGVKAYQTSNGKKLKLTTKESENGLVAVEIPPHFNGNLYSYFGMSIATIWGGIITLLTFFTLFIITCSRYSNKKRRKIRHK